MGGFLIFNFFTMTHADFFMLGVLAGTLLTLIAIAILWYQDERETEKELKEYKERAEKERQRDNIATIYDLTKDIWNDVKSFKVNQK